MNNTNPNPNPNAPQVRSIAIYLILTIVTCGIFGIYWLYTLNEDIGKLTGHQKVSGGLLILLSIVTCGIYELYWLYTQGQDIDEIKTKLGVNSSNTGILYLVLGLLTGGIIPYCLMQNEINNIVSGRYGSYQ